MIELAQFDINCVFYGEPSINTVMDNSNFIRLVYSNKTMVLSSIFLLINMKIIQSEKYFNKYKYTFNTAININEIQKIIKIERDMLTKVNISGKNPVYRISEQIQGGSIKLFGIEFANNEFEIKTNEEYSMPENRFIIKLSGLWENETEYGITYKFIKYSPNSTVAATANNSNSNININMAYRIQSTSHLLRRIAE